MSLLKEVFKVTLDVIPSGDTAPVQIQDALRGMGFRYNGIHHEPVNNDSYSRAFYQFKGKAIKTTHSSDKVFEIVYKKEIEDKVKGLSKDIRVTIHDKRFE